METTSQEKLILSVVTPVSRPRNIPRIAESIRDGICRIPVVWYCVLDAAVSDIPQVPDDLKLFKIRAPQVDPYGYAHRNRALEYISEGWVYFLDDDNIIHPDFESTFLESLEKHPRARWFCFQRLRANGTVYLNATDDPRVGRIDTGQVVLLRSLIGDKRFREDVYEGDGLLYEELAKIEYPVAVHKSATYYNYLR